MRDVTDNRTGELAVGEVKRGRGRPRKADAMTNAERQAAYRARHRQSVTVTKNALAPRLIVDQVDAYDECRLEVDALRAELAEAHQTIDELNGYVNSRDRENDHLVEVHDELVAVRRQLELAEAERNKAFAANGMLKVDLAGARMELAAAKKGASKSVTGNGNPVSFDVMVELITRTRKARGWRDQAAIFETPAWERGVVGAGTTDEQMRLVREAIFPPSKTVTRKA